MPNMIEIHIHIHIHIQHEVIVKKYRAVVKIIDENNIDSINNITTQ